MSKIHFAINPAAPAIPIVLDVHDDGGKTVTVNLSVAEAQTLVQRTRDTLAALSAVEVTPIGTVG